MPILHQRAHRHRLSTDERADVDAVLRVARRLGDRLAEFEDEIDLAHVHNASSAAIQAIVSRVLTEIGFREEVVLTPQDGLVSQARPDFVYSLGPDRGVLAEVERGGTLTNNHDLKDMWKAHVAPDAQHLILVVPSANWRSDGLTREKPFVRVCQRMFSFFGDERREVDVLSCHVIGYGLERLPG